MRRLKEETIIWKGPALTVREKTFVPSVLSFVCRFKCSNFSAWLTNTENGVSELRCGIKGGHYVITLDQLQLCVMLLFENLSFMTQITSLTMLSLLKRQTLIPYLYPYRVLSQRGRGL